ncbi:MAG: glycosyltransferase family 4 protein [Rubrobacter sp.]
MRVAFVTVGDTSRRTGGYLYHARVSDGLEKHGIEVEEIVPSGASAAEQECGIPNLAAFDPRGFEAVVVDALARIVVAPFIKDWRKACPVVALVHELPSLAAPEGDVEKERGFEEALLGAELFVAVSAHGKSVLESRGVSTKRIRVVSPGFDGLESKTARRAVSLVGTSPCRRRFSTGETSHRNAATTGTRNPADSDTLQALCVAQWIERKGILDLVEAWKMVKAPNASLRLVGETDADPEYRSRVMSAIGEDASIRVSGTLDDESLAAAYADSDFFALSSRFEGYGIVYAEALSFGLPVVACDVGPVPELVGREAGVFVSPRDKAGLSRELGNLLADGELRDRMSEAALRRAGNLRRWEDTVRGFAEVLREVERG